MLERIVAELGQGPVPVRETNRCRRLVGQLAQDGPLLCGKLGRGAAALFLAEPVQSVTVESVQISLNRVGVESEEASDRGRIPSLSVQLDGFRAAQLVGVGSGVQELSDLPKFSGRGPPGGHGAGHEYTSPGESH